MKGQANRFMASDMRWDKPKRQVEPTLVDAHAARGHRTIAHDLTINIGTVVAYSRIQSNKVNKKTKAEAESGSVPLSVFRIYFISANVGEDRVRRSKQIQSSKLAPKPTTRQSECRCRRSIAFAIRNRSCMQHG